MLTFDAPDGTRLAYHRKGSGGDRPLVCIAGGPMMASAYFGDLGGLAAQRELVQLDLRGTGESAAPADLAGSREAATPTWRPVPSTVRMPPARCW